MASSSTDPATPLINRTVLVACSAKKMSRLLSGLEAMGAIALPAPVIQIVELKDNRRLDESLRFLRKYSWVIFTSAHGVSYFMRRSEELGVRIDGREMPKICAIGPATAREVREHSCKVDLMPDEFVAEGVVQALFRSCGGANALKGLRILIPRAKVGREVLPDALARSGAIVDLVPCYQTVQAPLDDALIEALHERLPDLVVFTSSSTVTSLVTLLGPEVAQPLLRRSTVAAIGRITGETLESFGRKADIIPEESTIPSLLDAIRRYYTGNTDRGTQLC